MDWSNPIGSAVSGGFGIIGQLVNYGLQKRLAAQQNEYNLQMWNLQNEYNSPQAQMQRLEDAGLNKALMYGQGSTGNAASAPQMVTPEAPKIDKHMAELAQAFNIEGIKTAVANRKKAQAEARIARAAADDRESDNEALRLLEHSMSFDPLTGTFTYLPGYGDWSRDPGSEGSLAYGKLMHLLESNFRNTSLLYPRASLIDSTRRLNQSRINLLAPQIGMRSYEESMYPYGYWIDKGTKVFNALPFPKFNVKLNR